MFTYLERSVKRTVSAHDFIDNNKDTDTPDTYKKKETQHTATLLGDFVERCAGRVQSRQFDLCARD